ncbi:MAG TPA: hypothetical protein VK550_16535, partial [Polyangiaceae bacterium]|nr:hypothetical protein [Polyangiaceae bacterium]
MAVVPFIKERPEAQQERFHGSEIQQSIEKRGNYVQRRSFVHRGGNILPSLCVHRWGLHEHN